MFFNVFVEAHFKVTIEGDVKIKEGGELLLICESTPAIPSLEFHWTFVQSRMNTSVEISRSQTLSKQDVALDDTGEYTCEVSSGLSESKDTVVIKLEEEKRVNISLYIIIGFVVLGVITASSFGAFVVVSYLRWKTFKKYRTDGKANQLISKTQSGLR